MSAADGYFHVYNVPLEKVEKWWPVVRPWIANACKHNPYGEPVEVFEELCRQPGTILQIWIKGRDPVGCSVLEMAPQGRLHVAVISGRRGLLEEGATILAELEHVARLCGRRWITGEGRRGWARKLARWGFESLGGGKYRRAVK
jgi:hypothetical protein